MAEPSYGEKIDYILQYGISQELAEQALARTNGNQHTALYLLLDDDLGGDGEVDDDGEAEHKIDDMEEQHQPAPFDAENDRDRAMNTIREMGIDAPFDMIDAALLQTDNCVELAVELLLGGGEAVPMPKKNPSTQVHLPAARASVRARGRKDVGNNKRYAKQVPVSPPRLMGTLTKIRKGDTQGSTIGTITMNDGESILFLSKQIVKDNDLGVGDEVLFYTSLYTEGGKKYAEVVELFVAEKSSKQNRLLTKHARIHPSQLQACRHLFVLPDAFTEVTTVIKNIIRTCGNAFVNTDGGGVIYFGVQDDGCIVGVDVPEYRHDEIRACIMEEFDAFVPKVKKTHVAIYFDTVGNMTIQGHKPCVDMFVIRVEIERGTSPIYENTRHAAWIIDEVTNIVRQVSAEDIAPRVNVHQQSRIRDLIAQEVTKYFDEADPKP